MEDKLITIGNKIELKQVLKRRFSEDDGDVKTYVSQVLDMTEGLIHAAMPISEGHLIPLELGSFLVAYFHTSKGLYKANCTVTGRSKVDNIYIAELEITSALEKFQRREFYRLPCYIDAVFESVTDSQYDSYVKNKIIPVTFGETALNGVITDISGGGVRMLSPQRLEKDTLMAIRFRISSGMNIDEIDIMVKVISVIKSDKKSDEKSNLYEHRLQYKLIPKEIRDIIVKYIYEEQRRIRHKERN